MFDAKISVRSRVEHLTSIKALLNVGRTNLFRTTVFGAWLDFPSHNPDNYLYNFFYQNAVMVPKVSDFCPPLNFQIGDNLLEFGREQFSLVTGFRLGHVDKDEGRIVRGIPYSPFLDRLFPEIKVTKKKRIKGQQILGLLKPGQVWDSLSDEDAVRCCLLVIATCVFMGREGRFYIPDHLLIMVEDFSLWNEYPWGEYLWCQLYKRTVNVVPRHENTVKESKKPVKKSPKKEETFNLYGFIWALKVSFYS